MLPRRRVRGARGDDAREAPPPQRGRRLAAPVPLLRAARASADERQPRVRVDRSGRARRLRDPAARPRPRDERLEHHLRRDGAARDRRRADDRARDGGRARDRRRPGAHGRRPAATAAASGSRWTACRASSTRSTCRSTCPASAPCTSTSPTAAATTCWPMSPSSACSLERDSARAVVEAGQAIYAAARDKVARAASDGARDRLHLLRDADRRRRPGERPAARRHRAVGPDRPVAVRHGQLGAARLHGGPRPGRAGRALHGHVADRLRVRRRAGRRDARSATAPAILPRISGRGFVVGSRTAAVDPNDPYPLGYALSDLWDMSELELAGSARGDLAPRLPPGVVRRARGAAVVAAVRHGSLANASCAANVASPTWNDVAERRVDRRDRRRTPSGWPAPRRPPSRPAPGSAARVMKSIHRYMQFGFLAFEYTIQVVDQPVVALLRDDRLHRLVRGRVGVDRVRRRLPCGADDGRAGAPRAHAAPRDRSSTAPTSPRCTFARATAAWNCTASSS